MKSNFTLEALDAERLRLRVKLNLLLVEAEKKTVHMRRLIENHQIPLMASDGPVREWCAIMEDLYAISALDTVEQQTKAQRQRTRRGGK